MRRTDLPRLTNAKVIPSDNVAPQHRFAIIDIHMDLGVGRKVRRTGIERIKWWKLNERKADLEVDLETLVVNLNLNQPAPEIHQHATEQIRDLAHNILGTTKPGGKFVDKHTWGWNGDVQEATRGRNEAFKNGLPRKTSTTTTNQCFFLQFVKFFRLIQKKILTFLYNVQRKKSILFMHFHTKN